MSTPLLPHDKSIPVLTDAELKDIIILNLGLDTTLAQACVPVIMDNLRLMNRKQHDYGSHNLTRFGTLGVVVRASDKMERLITLTKPGVDAQVKEESVADTLMDLSNYGLIGYVINKKLWQ